MNWLEIAVNLLSTLIIQNHAPKFISVKYLNALYKNNSKPDQNGFINTKKEASTLSICFPLFTTFFETIKIKKYLNKKIAKKKKKHQNKKLTIEDNVYCENPVMFTMQ